jgi:Icc-related predicted phosphoesterase
MIKRFFVGCSVIAGFLFPSCKEAFEFSPNQVFDDNSAVNLNAISLEKLYSAPSDDTITIAFVGDSQRFYDELDLFIDTVNSYRSVDFILLAGDISDFGLLAEFELIAERLAKLEKPFIGVVGNHDVLAKGDEVFERMFGPLNFSFIYNDVKFIVHNTNSKEFEQGLVPDLAWLGGQLTKTDSAKYAITVSHVPPFSEDFDKDLEPGYAALLQEAPHLVVSLHGHIHEHRDGYPYNDGVRYITSHSFDQQSFVLLKIVNGEVLKTIVDY